MSQKLESLAKRIAEEPAMFFGAVPYGPVVTHDIEGVTSILWFREEDMQVQLFAVPPNHIIPEHTHPNVDSYELMVGGDIEFSKNGDWVTAENLETCFPTAINIEAGLHPSRGAIIRIYPDTPHGGAFGPRGGVFMSIQQWLNGVEPHCVSHDYDGVVMGDHHLAGVKKGNAKSKGGQAALTWQDAARKAIRPPVFGETKH